MQASHNLTPCLPGEIVGLADPTSTLPLEHVEVQAQVIGMLASVAMAQRFANPFGEPVELLYRFAIPHRASLVGFSIQVGSRTIDGEMAEREQAAALYQEAIAAGQRAALTTEERPNLYSVQIGNVQPGETIVARYQYSLHPELDGGEFELAIPFGVVPRYHHSGESPEEAAMTDVAIAPSGAPVASLDVDVAIDAGLAIEAPVSPSHQIDALLQRQSGLAERETIVKLSKEFEIVTPFTALVAVDQVVVGSARKPRRIAVASPLPEGVTFGADLNMPSYATSLLLRHSSSSPVRPPSAWTARVAPGYDALPMIVEKVESIDDLDPYAPSPPSSAAISDASRAPGEADRLLRDLIREQRASGAWADDAGSESVELTAAATVAFARAGHTPNRGIFRRQLRRALEWLRSHARTPGEQQYLSWARAEVAVADGDGEELTRAAARSVAGAKPVNSAIGAAIVARVDTLTRNGDGHGRREATGDARIAAITGGAFMGEIEDSLPSSWRACLPSSRSFDNPTPCAG